jgi:hypothetical protein
VATLRFTTLAFLFVLISACTSAEPEPTTIAAQIYATQTASVLTSPNTATSTQTLLAEITGPPASLSTLTATLTRILTATPSPQVLGIASSDVNIRTGPSTGYPISGLLKQGDQITIVGKSPDGKWWKFNLGWVSASYVQVASDTSRVPVVTPIGLPPTSTCTPTPTPTLLLFPTFTPAPQPSYQPPPASPAPPRPVCCKICTKGKACGNSCININYTCHQPPGCACNG